MCSGDRLLWLLLSWFWGGWVGTCVHVVRRFLLKGLGCGGQLVGGICG